MPTLKTLLALGRVSNLSTVWSNALCGWIVAGGADPIHLGALLAASSLLYVGGMFLNDYCDAAFDRIHRPERPIPSGAIRRETTLRIALALLATGLACLAWMGWDALLLAVALAGLIVAYNALHKSSPKVGPLLMAACRASLYPIAALAASDAAARELAAAAGGMFAYILGVTLLARSESTTRAISWPGVAWVAAPLAAAAVWLFPAPSTASLLALGAAAAWIGTAFLRARASGRFAPGRAIGPLLAGIPLIDLLALSALGLANPSVAAPFAAFFAIALIAQRAIPAS